MVFIVAPYVPWCRYLADQVGVARPLPPPPLIYMLIILNALLRMIELSSWRHALQMNRVIRKTFEEIILKNVQTALSLHSEPVHSFFQFSDKFSIQGPRGNAGLLDGTLSSIRTADGVHTALKLCLEPTSARMISTLALVTTTPCSSTGVMRLWTTPWQHV